MQRQNRQLPLTDAISRCRRQRAFEILGGDAEDSAVKLIAKRLTEARYAPPESWQHAADTLSDNELRHPVFEQQAVARAIREFSCQYFLLTETARQSRAALLLEASAPFAALNWRMQRLNTAVAFRAASLTTLGQAQRTVALQLCRLFALPTDRAALEARAMCHSVCASRSSASQFLKIIAQLRGIPGLDGILATTSLEAKVRGRSQRSRSRSFRKLPRIQQQRRRGSEPKPKAALPRGLVIKLAVALCFIVRLAMSGSGGSTPASYLPFSDYRAPTTSIPPLEYSASGLLFEREVQSRPNYVSPRFADSPSAPEVLSDNSMSELRKLLLEHDRRRAELLPNLETPWKPGLLLPYIDESLPDVASSELFASPSEPIPRGDNSTKPVSVSRETTAERIIQRHVEAERLLQHLRPEPLPDFAQEYQNPFSRLLPRRPTVNGRSPLAPLTSPSVGSEHVPELSDLPGLPSAGSSLFSPQTGNDD